MTFVTPCTPRLGFLLTLMEKYGITWKDLIAPILNALKTTNKVHFTTIRAKAQNNMLGHGPIRGH